jgi:hypothetical protein
VESYVEADIGIDELKDKLSRESKTDTLHYLNSTNQFLCKFGCAKQICP